MKRRAFSLRTVSLIVLTASATSAGTGDLLRPPPAVEEKRLLRPNHERPTSSQIDLVVERVWAEGERNFARIRLSNISGHDLDDVAVRCSEFDFSGEQLAAYNALVAGGNNGVLSAGMARTFQLDLHARGSALHALTCTTGAGLR